MTTLNLETLNQAVSGAVAAIRCNVRLQPAGGPGDKVFPPTYVADDKQNPLKYAHETRRIGGQDVKVVLLDSVASQANRLEDALRAAWEAGQLDFPVVGVDFGSEPGLEDLGLLTTLQTPHRIADALLRDAFWQPSADQAPVPFRHSRDGEAYTLASFKNATAVYRLCPTALVFGVWDSTGPRGGLGSKFQRALVSEVIGVDFSPGVKTASRIDSAAISSGVPIYHLAGDDSDWTLDPVEAEKDKQGKPILYKSSKEQSTGKASAINHSNFRPSKDFTAGGVTFDYAQQTTVLSLPALRRLRFPVSVDGSAIPTASRAAAESAARTALAALALAAIALQRNQGYDLRSRSLLVPESATPLAFEFISSEGGEPITYTVTTQQVLDLFKAASAAAAQLGFAWQRAPLTLKPMPKLVSLIRESRKLAAKSETEAAGSA
ncbi:CRISPR-associated protein Csb1 [Solimonas aquatica]|uniref:CRISPR-associated protein Csb1 n=1 Tax=Solimonas aquatica TaxID=489703 RepID=A0A1H9M996_9GAMM|nr:type I-U CRISPR-associated RAMP protein Csb1/Cas7u [Solimonas aquatica]SER20254.1 CRISPR-associated protein Csb1 [Solimonas aquatica]